MLRRLATAALRAACHATPDMPAARANTCAPAPTPLLCTPHRTTLLLPRPRLPLLPTAIAYLPVLPLQRCILHAPAFSTSRTRARHGGYAVRRVARRTRIATRRYPASILP